MSNTIFDRPDLSAFTRLDGLGLEVTGQRIEPDHAVLACRIVGEDRWCQRCGCQGISRDTVVRRLAHVPYGWRPTILHVSVRCYRCQECARVWRQDMAKRTENIFCRRRYARDIATQSFKKIQPTLRTAGLIRY